MWLLNTAKPIVLKNDHFDRDTEPRYRSVLSLACSRLKVFCSLCFEFPAVVSGSHSVPLAVCPADFLVSFSSPFECVWSFTYFGHFG